jgi:3D (Asp-Asp-Asp) domain-containing protein
MRCGVRLPCLAILVVIFSAKPFAAPDDLRSRSDIALPPEHATVTAYSSSPDETWGDPFITASGRRVFDGLVACPRKIPFGTKVRIGDRDYECHDRLHPKYDDRFDIWMSSKDEALEFGKQRLRVEVIEG